MCENTDLFPLPKHRRLQKPGLQAQGVEYKRPVDSTRKRKALPHALSFACARLSLASVPSNRRIASHRCVRNALLLKPTSRWTCGVSADRCLEMLPSAPVCAFDGEQTPGKMAGKCGGSFGSKKKQVFVKVLAVQTRRDGIRQAHTRPREAPRHVLTAAPYEHNVLPYRGLTMQEADLRR